jgi:hypothetical protein
VSVEALRKKRLWNVSDFAEWIGVPRKAALALLKQLNTETGGMLLRTGTGKRPTYTFLVGALAKAKPEVFERVESLEGRVEQLEEHMAERVRREKLIAAQTGENTREIARLRTRRAAA